jgi:hypothetical protein
MSAPTVKPKELQAIQPNAGVQPPKKEVLNPAKIVDTIESMKQEPETSSWKMWLAKLPCIGACFAWLFGIKVEEAEPEVPVNQVPKATTALVEANLKKDCLAAFAAANPDAASVTKSKDAFGQLSVRTKLQVLVELHPIAHCTPAHFLSLCKLLTAKNAKGDCQLHVLIQERRADGDARTGEQILEANSKDGIVLDAVKAYVLLERDNADAEREKMILAKYAGPDFPAPDVCKSALDCFKEIEGDKNKLVTLQKLMDVDCISDSHVKQFVATLPATPKAAAPKPAEPGKPAPTELAPAPQPVGPVALRDVLFAKLHARFGDMLELEKVGYEKALAAHVRRHGTGATFTERKPPAVDQLEGYFEVRHSNFRIREAMDRVIEQSLKEIV